MKLKTKIKIISVITALAMLLCILPSCGESEEQGPSIKNAMLYVGDTNKQGFLITLDGNTLKYETKLAATFDADLSVIKTFVQTFGREDCDLTIDDKQLKEYYKKLSSIISSWEDFYAPADPEKTRQYWFVEVYYDDGTYHNYSGYDNWPENYGEYITLTQQLCGKLFPEKIAAYMPEDIEAEKAAAGTAETSSESVSSVAS